MASTAPKAPNARLAYWFDRSGWNKHELARRVTQRAHDQGHRHVCTDATRVRRWLRGERPREPIPTILAQLFTERFGHAVTADMLGLDGPQAPLPRAGPGEEPHRARTVRALDDFSRSELMLNRRGFLSVGLGATVAAPGLGQPVTGWLAPGAEPAERPPARVGLSEIQQIERAIEAYWRWDNEHGGGVHRRAVAAHLGEVCDLLQATVPERLRQRLFSAAAQLAEIAGWMAHDMGRQATAQQYLTLAAEAAAEAGNPALRAEVLSRMARQMIHLRRPGDALELLREAQDSLAGAADANATTCLLYALQARAYAGLGAVQQVHHAVGRAEEAAVRSRASRTPTWIRYFDAAELAGCAGDSYRVLTDHDPAQAGRAETYIERALEVRDPEYVRCRAMDLSALAAARLAGGEPEHAYTAGRQALAMVSQLSSARLADRLREVKTKTARYGGVPAAVDLTEGIDEALTAVPA